MMWGCVCVSFNKRTSLNIVLSINFLIVSGINLPFSISSVSTNFRLIENLFIDASTSALDAVSKQCFKLVIIFLYILALLLYFNVYYYIYILYIYILFNFLKLFLFFFIVVGFVIH